MRLTQYFAVAGLLGVAMLPSATAVYWGPVPAPTLQALFSNNDCEAVPELLGQWSDITIQKLDDNKYRAIWQAQDPSTDREAFDICVARIDGHLFFDATEQRIRPDGKEVFDSTALWIPLHLIGRLDIDGNTVHFRLLDDDWLQDALKTGRASLTTARDEYENYIVTAPSEELRKFVALFASDPAAFSIEFDFERASPDRRSK